MPGKIRVAKNLNRAGLQLELNFPFRELGKASEKARERPRDLTEELADVLPYVTGIKLDSAAKPRTSGTSHGATGVQATAYWSGSTQP